MAPFNPIPQIGDPKCDGFDSRLGSTIQSVCSEKSVFNMTHEVLITENGTSSYRQQPEALREVGEVVSKIVGGALLALFLLMMITSVYLQGARVRRETKQQRQQSDEQQIGDDF